MNTTCLQAKDTLKKITLNAMDQFLTGYLTAEHHAKVLYALVYHGCPVDTKNGDSAVLSYLYADVVSCLAMGEEEIRGSLTFLKNNRLITPLEDGGYLLSDGLIASIPPVDEDAAHLEFRAKLLEQDLEFLRSTRLQRLNAPSKMVYANPQTPAMPFPVDATSASTKVSPLFPEESESSELLKNLPF